MKKIKEEELTQEIVNDFTVSILNAMKEASYEEIQDMRKELAETKVKQKKTFEKVVFFAFLLGTFILMSIISFVYDRPLIISISSAVFTLFIYYRLMETIHDFNLNRFSINLSSIHLNIYDKHS